MRGSALGTERPDVEDGEQVETMQLGRKLKPRLSSVTRQMLRWLGALLGARRFGWLASWALAGVALEQTQMWMFRRRTGHESLLSDSTVPLFLFQEDRGPQADCSGYFEF